METTILETGNIELPDEVRSYFKQSLERLADTAPSDSCVRGRMEGEGKGYVAHIDIASTTLTAHVKDYAVNPIVAIDLAVGDARDRVLDWRHCKERAAI